MNHTRKSSKTAGLPVGVRPRQSGKWQSEISLLGKKTRIGSFDTIQQVGSTLYH
jgi:hypothetical protein